MLACMHKFRNCMIAVSEQSSLGLISSLPVPAREVSLQADRSSRLESLKASPDFRAIEEAVWWSFKAMLFKACCFQWHSTETFKALSRVVFIQEIGPTQSKIPLIRGKPPICTFGAALRLSNPQQRSATFPTSWKWFCGSVKSWGGLAVSCRSISCWEHIQGEDWKWEGCRLTDYHPGGSHILLAAADDTSACTQRDGWKCIGQNKLAPI